ncbi:hypothetical protein SAMN03159495_3422 [Pseudomonas sp. NFR16]|nr:hypothetical protein SAMN03159495_3422 [Pseudomonas sp. NFR16]
MAGARNLAALGAWPLSASLLSAAGLFGPANLLGTVSQSGGIPTGAVIEYGTSATGDYVKFADGTMITNQVVTIPAQTWTNGTGVRYVLVSFTMPAVFAAPPRMFAQPVEGAVSTRGSWVSNIAPNSTSTATAYLATPTATTSNAQLTINVMSIGRWFT